MLGYPYRMHASCGAKSCSWFQPEVNDSLSGAGGSTRREDWTDRQGAGPLMGLTNPPGHASSLCEIECFPSSLGESLGHE